MAKKKIIAAKTCTACKFSPKALGLSFGIIWGLACLVVGILAMYGYGVPFVDLMGSLYKGYVISWGGAVIGGIWGFVDGFIAGYLIAWLYNRFC